MSFINISKEVINKVFTENGDKAFATTGSYCLDYFSLVGGMRNNLRDALNLFMKSYYEDPIIIIGASEAYEPRCRHCHKVPHRK